MLDEKINQEFRFKKKIDETRRYFVEEMKQNDLMSKKHKNVYMDLIYIEPLLILVSTINGCVSISGFTSLVCIPICIRSCAVGLKNCVMTLGCKKYKSIIKKKENSKIKSFFYQKIN